MNGKQNGREINPKPFRNRASYDVNQHTDDQSSQFHFYSSSDQHIDSRRNRKGIFGGVNDNFTNTRPSEGQKKLGTLNGVLLPTLQTILGVLLFLRLPSITAQAGCVYTTIIILICVTSTLITAISLSAIATNGTISAGGPYYVISRTLGLEVGSALGLLYYLGTTMACAMSILGAVEAILRSVGDTIENETEEAMGVDHSGGNLFDLANGLTRRFLEDQYDTSFVDPLSEAIAEEIETEIEIEIDHQFENGLLVQVGTQYLSLMVAITLTVVVSVGFRVIDMAANLFLAVVFLSLFCSVLGCILFAYGYHLGDLIPWDRIFMDNVWPNYTPDPTTGIEPDFFSCLALFYPSVTGILAGSSRSEYLADPFTSIPNGTIGAVFFSTAIYILIVWLFGLTIANYTLKTNKFILAAVAFPQDQVVKVGVIVSCLGSAMQYMTQTVQLLSAIAMDDSMPILGFIKRGHRETDINKRALWLTFILVSIPCLSGNLDHITPLATMCFLLMYGGINFCCFLLGFIQAPGFRPTFKYFHWSVSLVGCLWCLGLALVIDTDTAIFTALLFLILVWYNHKMVEKQKDWGDVFDSVKYNLVTKTLSSLSHSTTSDLNAKNWRPQLLTLMDLDSGGLPSKVYLISLASQLKKAKGINIVVGILVRGVNTNSSSLGNAIGMEDEDVCNSISKSKDALHQCMVREQLDGFAVVSATSRDGICDSVWSAVLHSGLGPVSPNTVLMSFPKLQDREEQGGCWSEESYVKTVTGIKNMKVALMMLRGCELFPRSNDVITFGVIDVWWIIHEGGLLLLLPYILSKNPVWGRNGGAKLRIFVITTSSTENPKKLSEAVSSHLAQARITAAVTVVDMSHTSIGSDMKSKQDCDTYSKTVVEWFSEDSYEVPYVPLSTNGDIEFGYAEDTAEDLEFDEDEVEGEERSNSMPTIVEENKNIENAIEFNKILKKYSSDSNLIVTNMPKLFPGFFNYVDALCDGLDNVLLIKGSGKEVITTYA